MLKKLFVLAILISAATSAFSQGELKCAVRVNTPQLQRTDRKVFDQMEVALRDWLNNTKWTNDAFEPEERVQCNFIITIKEERDNNTFEAEIAVQAVRPVYGSGYETPLISHLDKDFTFVYDQNQPIEFVLDNPENPNLTAMLSFYVYIILGLDYDSFSLYGGEQHLLTAQQIITNIQNSSSNRSSGWRPADGGKNRNRYWIIENLLSPRVKPYRAAMYTYHRKGLDMFTTDFEKGKAAVLQALDEIEKVNSAYFNAMIIQMFANSKKDELVEMWKIGARPQKERVFQIMSKIDPANTPRYHEIGV